jgi:hypothetical protein
MFPSQYNTMGRTFGPDLVIPTVQRQHFYNAQEHDIYYPHSNHLMQQQQQQQEQQQQQQHNLEETDNKRKKLQSETKQSKEKNNESEQEHFKPGQNSEIKFSIERILSNESTSRVGEVTEERFSENEDDDGDEDEDIECNSEDMKIETDTDESTHYEWLHCTRYKPPKLQRKLFSFI